MIVTSERREQFDERGFFVLESFFSVEEICDIATAIDSFAGDHDRRLRESGTQGISRPGEIAFTANLALKDPRIFAFCAQAKMVQLVTELIGPDVRLYWDQSVYKHPETAREFPWHQDNGYTPVIPAQYYTCWLALSDSTLENGCIRVLPGSHMQGPVEHRDSPMGRVGYDGPDPGIPVPLKSGSMAVFSSLLLHKSGPNLTDSTRKAYIIQYIPANACSGATGEPFEDRKWIAQSGKPSRPNR